MDQLCPKPHTTADKGRTEAGDRRSFAQTGLMLQKNTSGNCMGNSYIKKMCSQYFKTIQWGVEASHSDVAFVFSTFQRHE